MKRYISYKGTNYTLTYDEEGVLDTVTVTGHTELLSSSNVAVKYFVRHADKIYCFSDVKHITHVSSR